MPPIDHPNTLPPPMRGVAPQPGPFAAAAARVRAPLLWAWVGLIAVDWVFIDLPVWTTLGATVLVLALYFVIGTPTAASRVVGFPLDVAARAVNSPANRIPSHGLHAYGQTFALDLVPLPDERPDTDRWSLTGLSPQAFPGFGVPVLSPVDGVVATARDGARDHRSRTSIPGLVLLFVEGVVREVLGPNRIIGNHVTIDAGDGSYALLAHLRRGSVRVGVGDRVTASQPIGECGNSGNTTEPHVHVQLMDRRHPAIAAGLPFVFGPRETVPRTGDIATTEGLGGPEY